MCVPRYSNNQMRVLYGFLLLTINHLFSDGQLLCSIKSYENINFNHFYQQFFNSFMVRVFEFLTMGVCPFYSIASHYSYWTLNQLYLGLVTMRLG